MKKRTLFFIFLFISCSSPNPPKWYNKIYNDNANFIYATGVGKNKTESLNNALANAASKVSIIVKSIYKSKKYQYQGDDGLSYSSNSIFNIETKTNPITFSDYKILKLQKKDKYYILIQINRLKNAKYMCNNIEYPTINEDNLNIFLNYKKIISLLNKKINKLKDINALYPICKNKLNKIINFKRKITNKYNSFSFHIYSNDNKITNIIENILNIKTSPTGNIKIYINKKENHKKVGNHNITTLYFDIKIKTNNKIKNYSLTCAASSIENFNIARELAYKECEQKLKKIFKF